MSDSGQFGIECFGLGVCGVETWTRRTRVVVVVVVPVGVVGHVGAVGLRFEKTILVDTKTSTSVPTTTSGQRDCR